MGTLFPLFWLDSYLPDPPPESPVSIVSPWVILKSGERQVVVPRPRQYRELEDLARKHFRLLFSISLNTTQLSISEGSPVEITPESWALILDQVTVVNVIDGSTGKGQKVRLARNEERWLRITVNYHDGRVIHLDAAPSNRIETIKRMIQDREGILADDYYLVFNETSLKDKLTLSECNIHDQSVLSSQPTLRGFKPVVYLLSPHDLEAHVQLDLVPEWKFYAVYPVVPVKQACPPSIGQSIQWLVRTHQDGTLTELSSGIDIAYLFWEADTEPVLPLSPQPSPRLGGPYDPSEIFIPNQASLSLNSSNSVMLSTELVPLYLEKALVALGLHTEARTSFITFWLPLFLKHKYIALRFLPQTAYERAAPLNVSPPPDVTTRIFMLFRGVPVEDVVAWSEAVERAAIGVEMWRELVGVDVDKALNKDLFRVLEWGGMEVL